MVMRVFPWVPQKAGLKKKLTCHGFTKGVRAKEAVWRQDAGAATGRAVCFGARHRSVSQPGGPKDLTPHGASNTPSGRTAQEGRGYQNPVPCSAPPPHKLLDPERGWRPQCRWAQPASDTLQ